MMSGSLTKTYQSMDSPNGQSGAGDSPARKLGNGRHSPTSPLKLFGQAKKRINDIYSDMSQYIVSCQDFLENQTDEELVQAALVDKVQLFTSKVEGIREILSRDRMKVAFFGRTSNGKSTVINAMLKSKILPSGIGHTTHCFVQVEGTDKQEPFIMVEGSNSPRNIHDIRQMANALSKMKLESDTLVSIHWPKGQCNLLKDDVVLVDSPGIDVSPNIDEWIDKHCLDADVFVLVANAESTLMQTEKNFFHKVSSRLSKPNIFILNNRWDASASEPETMEEVKLQHLERTIAFLVDELNVMDRFQAEDRVFFVSAREALVCRAQGDAAAQTPTPTSTLLDGFQGRLFEFSNFERKFEECISQSAVQTKFAQHTSNGKDLTAELKKLMDEVCDLSNTKRNAKEQERVESVDRLDYMTRQLDLLTGEIKEKIKQMTDEVERKVSTALLEEIKRLTAIVDEFDRPFHPDIMLLNIYKKELHFHIEECLSRNLHVRCSTFVHHVLDAATIETEERLLALLPEETRQQAANILPPRDFEVAYRLDCRNLCADFQEDIQFRFSLGITALMNRFLGPKGRRAVLTGGGNSIPRPMPMTPQTPSNGSFPTPQESEIMVAMLGSFSSLYSRSTVGMLAVSGVVAKAAGWRILAVCGTIYGLIYVYERLSWTTKAKERAFKRQYVDYASSKLKLIVDLTSANCSHQVQQELSSTFARLCHQVDIAKGELAEETKLLDKEVASLGETASQARTLRNKAGYLDSELNSFVQQYLKPESRL